MLNAPRGDWQSWQPSATLETLRLRAKAIQKIRAFFEGRGVLEVTTPVWLPEVAPERHQTPPVCSGGFLLTSPETCMKRLVAAGSGAIFQMGPAFRQGESGRLHHPEFTMLEWYRPHWGLDQLVDEVTTLIQLVLPVPAIRIMTFQEAFQSFVGADPFQAPLETLAEALNEVLRPGDDRPALVDRLFVQRLEPAIAPLDTVLILTGFPPWEPGMAELNPGPPKVARRFEVFFRGVELANGYQESRDPLELEQRMLTANAARRRDGLNPLPIDRKFLQAMEAGFPSCAGVALGVDRLLMLAFDKEGIDKVMTFQELPGSSSMDRSF
ncbi:MAG: EF-P lysine aminoacylase GenX [Magnetococcales bacterium]|nr:EF-P lysine aminoacylase GenX [Magnetococcales bacterium]